MRHYGVKIVLLALNEKLNILVEQKVFFNVIVMWFRPVVAVARWTTLNQYICSTSGSFNTWICGRVRVRAALAPFRHVTNELAQLGLAIPE